MNGSALARSLLLALLAGLLLAGCTERQSEPAAEPDVPKRDVSGYLPGHGPEAPTWPPSPPAAPAAPRPSSVAPASLPDPGATIRGVIKLAPGAEAPQGGVLFIIARPGGIPGSPPVAVKRISSPKFPVSYALTEADSMVPGRPLDARIEVTARLDTDGNASTRDPSDLQGSFAANPVKPGQSDVDFDLAPSQP